MSTEEGSQARWHLGRILEDLERVRRGPQRPLEALEAVRHAQHALADVRDLLTTAARREGATWAQIGRALGISRQAVHQAHHRHQAEAQARHQRARYDRDLPPLPVPRRRFRWPFRRAV